MGYERDGRDDGRSPYDDRQPRQDYDRSYGRSYGARSDPGRDDARREDYRREDYRREDQRREAGGPAYQGYGRDRQDDPRAERNRFASSDRDYGRRPQGYDQEERGFLDRAGDEVRSWFGDEEAERRRRLDDRYAERDERDSGYRGGTRGAGDDRQGFGHDPSYRSWRDRQLEQFDRDYEDYRREHQSKFDAEFHGWRTNRQTQREALGRVKAHQEVVGSDGKHVGTVDKVRGETIILTKQDQDAGGRHHAIPSAWITAVDDKVTIAKTADEAHAHWRDAEQTSAFWGDGRRDQSDPARAGGGASAASASATAGTDRQRTPGQNG